MHKEQPIDIIDMPLFAAPDKTHRDNLLSLAVVVFKPPFLRSPASVAIVTALP
jgi:hypothetical protein